MPDRMPQLVKRRKGPREVVPTLEASMISVSEMKIRNVCTAGKKVNSGK
jgi:hypothetical protein